MLKFKNKSGTSLDVWRPAELGGRTVKANDTIEIEGELVESRPAPKDDEPAPEPIPEDAYLVAHNGEEKTWPHALWELVADKPAARNVKSEKE